MVSCDIFAKIAIFLDAFLLQTLQKEVEINGLLIPPICIAFIHK